MSFIVFQPVLFAQDPPVAMVAELGKNRRLFRSSSHRPCLISILSELLFVQFLSMAVVDMTCTTNLIYTD